MKFFELSEEDKKILITAFEKDGYKIVKNDHRLIVKRNKETIILDKLNKIEIKFDPQKFFKDKIELQKKLEGDFDTLSLFNFLEYERKEKENAINCLKRVAKKLNWYVMSSDKIFLNNGKIIVDYVELNTDKNRDLTILKFSNIKKLYAVEKPAYYLDSIFSFDQDDYLRENAPEVFNTLQAIGI